MGNNAKRDYYKAWLQLLPPERIQPGAAGAVRWMGIMLFTGRAKHSVRFACSFGYYPG
jgi:hypothetical protein